MSVDAGSVAILADLRSSIQGFIKSFLLLESLDPIGRFAREMRLAHPVTSCRQVAPITYDIHWQSYRVVLIRCYFIEHLIFLELQVLIEDF